jgi:spermidine/putrescine ABC transporter ATP-binding subunit
LRVVIAPGNGSRPVASASVRLEHVTTTFGDAIAVNDVSFDVQPGEFLTMLGPSGCGKTTLLRIIAGFINPSGGDIYINDERITEIPAHKRHTGMVFQNYALFPHMTVFDNLAYGLRLRKLGREDIALKVKEALELIRLEGYGDRYPRQLSGGQQQRVALARAIIINPDVLLLDEPLSNLDYKLRLAMRSEIRRIQRDTGITTVFVTHDQAEALTMSDRIVILSKGRIMQIGRPTDVYENPSNKFVADFIGDANFFDGTVVASDTCEVAIALGPLTLYAPLTGDVPRIGASASFSVRPERLRIQPRGVDRETKRNVYDATVEDHDYLGAVVRYYLRLGDGLLVKVDEHNVSGVRYRSGETVTVEIPPDDCFVLPVAE